MGPYQSVNARLHSPVQDLILDFFFSFDFNLDFGLGFERLLGEEIGPKSHRFLEFKEVTQPVLVKTGSPSLRPFGRREGLAHEHGVMSDTKPGTSTAR